MPLRYVLQIFVVVLFAGIGSSGFAELRIDITQGNMRPLPIAIPNFLEAEGATQSFGKKVTTVISANLARSGLFDVLDPKSFIQTLRDMETPPRFGDWRVINSEILVSGKITALPEEKIQVAFRLWDVLSEKSMLGMAFTTESQNWRRVSHIITDAIYKRLTGESGYFDSRIVYIAESGPKKNRIKRLAVMDQDGANHRFLSDGRSLVLTPRFSPTRQEITYLSYFNNTPRVYLFNIETGQHEMLGTFKGMTFAPRFSADGNAMLMSYADTGNSDIYMMDLQTRRPKRLTTHPAIDTSPSASPDNARIVFNSDRGGSPQLYVMNADGSDVNRISFSQGRYATPVWSPRGDLIAFTRQMRGRFYIGVMRPDGTGERLLTESFLDEGPTWAPNGRVLMFFRQEPGENGQVRLFSIDLTGYNLREVITPGDSSDPAWSPLNQ